MGWVTKDGKHVSSDLVSRHCCLTFERIENLNKMLAGRTGHPMTLMVGGYSRYGKFIYKNDGFVYTSRRKSPIGRYLRIERGPTGFELALKCGRVADVADLERRRWKILCRLKDKLVPELARRVRKIRKYKRSFVGYYAKDLYKIEFLKEVNDIRYNLVNNDEKNLEVLDHMAADWTDPEDDKMAVYFISMADRVARAHRSLNAIEAYLLQAIDTKVHDKCGLDPKHGAGDAGALVDIRINGRTYATWIGRGWLFKNGQTNITEFWPTPDRKVFDLNCGPLTEARYV
jgi:hypothetical protein